MRPASCVTRSPAHLAGIIPRRRVFLFSLIATWAVGRRVTTQPAVPSTFTTFPYDVRPSDLSGEPQLAALIADLREAARRRDAALVEPWLGDAWYSLRVQDDEEEKGKAQARTADGWPVSAFGASC
ncbi:MAG TPA: hypothetical protein VMF13_07100 [Luteitalea sp.]|nr:hypothetical protein [Luteitalea sp.]